MVTEALESKDDATETEPNMIDEVTEGKIVR